MLKLRLSYALVSLCRAALLAAVFVLPGCSTAQPPEASADAAAGLDEPLLYEFLVGEIALQRGDTELAARTFLDLAKRTRDPRVARRAVEVASSGRMMDVGLEAARLWHELEPASPQALQVVAVLLVGAKRVEEAEPYLAKLLGSDSVNVEGGFMQLNRLLASNPDKAVNLRVVRRLAEKHAGVPQAHFAVAQAAFAAGEDEEALAAVRRAAKLRPDWEPGVILEAQILQRRSPAEAARRLGEFVAAHPEAREARMNYARALVLDKRFPEARKQFEAILAASPGNTEVIYAVGLLAFQLKDYVTAEQNMKRLLDLGYREPNAVRYLLGQIAEEQKQWPRAIEWYQAIDIGEHALPARLRTASAMAKQGRLDEARAYLRKIEPDSPEQQVQLTVAEAQLLREANRNAEAYEVLGQALQKTPEQPDLLYDLALTAEKLGHFDALEANLRKLIAMRPDHAHAYNALGYSLADRSLRLSEARKLIEKALEISPEDHFIMDSLGWVLYRQGDLKGAAAQLRRAYNGRPDAEIGAHLGEVLWMLGERDEAKRVWSESLQSSPENETLRKTIERFRQ